MKHRTLILLCFELLLMAGALLQLWIVLNSHALHSQLWPSDPNVVVVVIRNNFLMVLFVFSVLPYLIGSFLADLLRSYGKLLIIPGTAIYLMIMLPHFGTTGPYSGMQNFGNQLCMVPLIGFPLLLTGKVLWLVLRPTPHIPGFCPACGYDLRASKDKCPECGGTIVKKI